jgi:hypothetical protein
MFSEGHYLYCHYKEFVVGGLSRPREPRRRHRYGQSGASANLQGGYSTALVIRAQHGAFLPAITKE